MKYSHVLIAYYLCYALPHRNKLIFVKQEVRDVLLNSWTFRHLDKTRNKFEFPSNLLAIPDRQVAKFLPLKSNQTHGWKMNCCQYYAVQRQMVNT
jgi:hypothetical protein